MILEERQPKNLLDKFLHFFKKDLGTGFTGLNLKFKYRIEDPPSWGKYDYDGRGSEWLSRDLEGYLIE